MDLLECMGLDPKEQAKIDAKIGIELAVSGRLEYKVKEQLRERLDGFEVEDAIANEIVCDCGRAMRENGGTKCLECENSEKYGYWCEVMAENGDYEEMYGHDHYDSFDNCVGGCEAHFWGVCKAETEEDYEKREICMGCTEFNDVIEHLAYHKLPIKMENIHGVLPARYLIRLGHKPVFKTDEDGKVYLQIGDKTYGVYGEDNVIFTDEPTSEEVIDIPDEYPHEHFMRMCEVVLGIDFGKEWEQFQKMGEFLTLPRNKDWQLRFASTEIPKRARELMELKHFLETGSWD